MAELVDKSMPIAVVLYNALSCGEGGAWRGPSKTLLFNGTHGISPRVPLTKLLELDRDIYQYLIALLVVALAWVGEALVMLEGIQITTVIREAFDTMLLKESGHNYDNYGLVNR